MFSNRICKSPILRSTIIVLLSGCTAWAQTAPKKPASKSSSQTSSSASSSAAHGKGKATVAEAQAFMKKAEDQLEDLDCPRKQGELGAGKLYYRRYGDDVSTGE